MKNTVLFDMDGVVVDTEGIWRAAEIEFMQRRSVDFDVKDVARVCTGKSFIDCITELRKLYGITGEDNDLVRERFEIVSEKYKTADFCKGFKDFFAKNIDGNKLKCALATSCEKRLVEIIKEPLGFNKFFGEHIYTIADVGYVSKPAPDIFLYAATQVGATPGECIVIEDSPHGVMAAKNAGMFCIALSWTFNREMVGNADVVVDSFEELNTIFHKFL